MRIAPLFVTFASLVTSLSLLGACGGVDAGQFTHGAIVGAAGDPTAVTNAKSGPAASGGSGALEAEPPATEAGAAGAAGAAQESPPVCVAEICNGKDDDCDGTVDEGCPFGLALGNPVQQKDIGDSQGGSIFAENCAADELAVGISVATGAWLEQVTPLCQKFALSHVMSSGTMRYALALGSRRALASHPETASSSAQDLACRDGSVLVGLRISQQHAGDYMVIPQIALKCAEPSLTHSDGTPGFSWQSPLEIGPVSGSSANNTAWFESDLVSNNELVVGFHGATGDWVDRIGLTTTPLSVLVQAE